jgi:iron transport multicopper oxidase
MSSGLAAVFIEAPEKMQETNTSIPQVFRDHCDYWKMPTSGNIVGKMSTTDFAGQPWGPFPLKMVGRLIHYPNNVDVQGWTSKAIGAMAGCILTALLGFLTVVFYASGEVNEEEVEEELRYKAEMKRNKGSVWKRVGRVVRRD